MWQQLHVEIDAEHAESLADTLMEFGALSVSLLDPADQAIYEPLPGTTPLWAQTRVSGLFEAQEDMQSVQARLDAWSDDSLSYRLEIVAEQDWVRNGQANFNPTCFAGRLWIYPSWSPPPPVSEDSLILQLDPGLAFGTGTHPTTALCLEWLARQPSLAGKRVLDYGCGSGILALVAAKLGATEIWAVDHEVQALQASNENAAQNAVSAQIHTCLPSDLPTPLPMSLVLANILANPLCELATSFATYCPPGADLVLSGILTEQEAMIRAAYASHFHIETVQEWQGWLCITAKRI